MPCVTIGVTAPVPNTERYPDADTNHVKLVAREPVSIFGVLPVTARSFAMAALEALQQGALVVRIDGV